MRSDVFVVAHRRAGCKAINELGVRQELSPKRRLQSNDGRAVFQRSYTTWSRQSAHANPVDDAAEIRHWPRNFHSREKIYHLPGDANFLSSGHHVAELRILHRGHPGLHDAGNSGVRVAIRDDFADSVFHNEERTDFATHLMGVEHFGEI